ncbi:MAG: hypothetical protein AAB466_09680 [Verrucomicrobiota bacterium]
MELSILTCDEPSQTHLLRLQCGPWADRDFVTAWHICKNPLCACQTITLFCAEDRPQPLVSDPPPLVVCLDVVRRQLARPTEVKMDSRSPAFAKAVRTELQPDDWVELYHLWSATKQDQVRRADPNTLDAVFAPGVMAGEETMVGFSEP